MKKVKITVLRKMFNEDLVKEYGAAGIRPCPMLREGQVFYADYAKPDGFCDEAWKAIYQYVFALAHGATKEPFYYSDWISKPAWPSVVVTTVYGRSFSNWRPPTKKAK